MESLNIPITKEQVKHLKMGFTPTLTWVNTGEEKGEGFFYPNRKARRKAMKTKPKTK